MSFIRIETRIGAPPEVCFELSLTVDTHLTVPGSRERVVGGVTSGVMKLNDQVTWESRRFRVPIRMTSQIVELDDPRCFIDEMVRGPFARWRHVHRFERSDGMTLMTDEIDFASPFGPVGWLVDRMFMRRYVYKLIGQQNRHMQDMAERR